MNTFRHPIASTEARFAAVDRDVSWLRAPLNWRLQIWGQGVGGYAPADGSVSRFADETRAEIAAQVWMELGIYPAQQTEAHRRLVAAHPAAHFNREEAL